MYAQGHTAKQIAETLNSKGYKTATNKKFTEKSFQTMLKNRKYTGVYIYDDITIENGIPAIIDKNTFDLVQQRVEKNKKAPARSKGKVDYVLTTKLFCGDCGLPMIGESGTSKNGSTYHYYKCQGRKKYKTCNMKTVQKDKIEEVVINNTLNKMLTDETIEKIADAVMELHDKELNDSSLLVDLERRKKDIEKALNNLLYAIEQGIITETTKNRLTELEAEKKEVENKISREKLKKPTISKDYVMYFLHAFKKGNSKDVGFRQKIIDTLINSVYVYEDKIVATYNYSEDKTKMTHKAVTTALGAQVFE